eukprot:8396080-Alexandrium_andersonii.AAC.1
MHLAADGSDSVCFRAWGEEWYPLVTTKSGNPASSLLDFSTDGHPGVDRVEECYTVVLDPTFDTWDGAVAAIPRVERG